MTQRPLVSLESAVRASSHVVAAEHPGEVVILDPRASRYYGLDEVGAEVWSRIEGTELVPVRDLVTALETEYEVPRRRLEEDVLSLLGDLAERSLIDVDPPA